MISIYTVCNLPVLSAVVLRPFLDMMSVDVKKIRSPELVVFPDIDDQWLTVRRTTNATDSPRTPPSASVNISPA